MRMSLLSWIMVFEIALMAIGGYHDGNNPYRIILLVISALILILDIIENNETDNGYRN